MHVVLTYDISADGRRNRLHKRLKKLLRPVQYSVFEGEVPPSRLALLEATLGRVIDPAQDSVRMYSMCRACAGLVRSYGVTPEIRPPDAPIVVVS